MANRYPGWVPSGHEWDDYGRIARRWHKHAAKRGCRGENVDRLGGPILGSHYCNDCTERI